MYFKFALTKENSPMPKVIGLPKVRFNLFDWNTNQETYIILYFQYTRGKRLKYSTGWKIRPNDWDRYKQRARHSKRFAESTFLNSHLERLEQLCKEIYLEKGRSKISPEDFRQELKIRLGDAEREEEEEVKRPLTFLEFVEEYYQERKQQPNANPGTLKFLHKVKVHIQNYARDRKRKLEFTELNDKFFSDFRDWLHAPPRLLSTNYVQKVFQYIKVFARKSESRGYHSNRAYQDFKLPKTPVSKIALSFEQLEQLHTLELADNPRLEKVRDLFLIGAYTGLRFSDFTRIRPEHIQTHKGERIIEITTQKTDQTVYIPLHPVLDDVLKKYGYKSPHISNQKMNDYLKELGQVAEFDKEVIVNDATGGIRKEKKVPFWEMLTTHVARRSFATNFYQKHPEQIDRIMKITGHKTERMFREYIVTDALDSAVDFGKAISKNT